MSNFHPRTLVLIGVLVTVVVVLLGASIWNATKKGSGPALTQQNTVDKVEKTAIVYFSPESMDLSSGTSSATVDVNVNSGKGKITAVQAEIQYDPTVIRNVRVLPPDDQNSLFGVAGSYTTLFNDTQTPGKISFALGILPTGNPVSGTGSVGKISFNVLRSKPFAEFMFTNETVVTSSKTQESILDYTTPLTIKLQSTPASSSGL